MVMKILLINGPNLQLLGVREPGIYGNDTLPAIVSRLRTLAEELGCELVDFQSNHEGVLVDVIQSALGCPPSRCISAMCRPAKSSATIR